MFINYNKRKKMLKLWEFDTVVMLVAFLCVILLLNVLCFVLDQHGELDFYSVSSLKQQSVGRRVTLLGHIILIPSQPVFSLFLLNAACLVEKQQISIL
jgi:hypothetical protein